MTSRRTVTVLGAGVVGQVYAGRLAAAGHDVHLLARGSTLETLRAHGVRLRRAGQASTPPVTVVGDPTQLPEADVAYLAVRADQVDTALPLLEQVPARLVVTLVNLAGDAAAVADRIGPERAVLGFSGVGGTRREDGVDYHQVRQQPTMIGRLSGREQSVVADLKDAGLPVDLVEEPTAWLATHAVFIAGIGAAILEAGGSQALASDPERMSRMVLAIRSAFRALERRGVRVTPAPLRTIFTRVPKPIAMCYWSRQLRGELGTLALEPHVMLTRATEFPYLVAQARAPTGTTSDFDQALAAAGYPVPEVAP